MLIYKGNIMKVFISHSRKDKLFLRKLKADLEENYISTWVDEDEMYHGDTLAEKLTEGIDETTHFVIVLTPNSIKSEWVRYELKSAIKASNKIIPIKFRDCEVPKEIESIIFFDLSNEIVETKGSRIEFITSGYSDFLKRFITEIRSQKYKLTTDDKTKIQEKINPYKTSSKDNNLLQIYLKVVGFKILEKRKNKILSKIQDNESKKIYFIKLPPLFNGLQEGDKIKIVSKENNITKTVYFAGYLRNNLKFALNKRIINQLLLDTSDIYAFEFNKKRKSISIIDE